MSHPQSNQSNQLLCGDKILDLSRPQVMGILNVTPNSYCQVGRVASVAEAGAHAEQMVAEGAAIIDVGGEPTNPGVHPVISLQEELDRVIPVVAALTRRINVPISVDTSKAEVMKQAIAHGASFINDVRGLRDPAALRVAAAANVPVCLMHMTFPDGNVKQNSADAAEDIVITVKNFLRSRLEACIAAGMAQDKIILDPGIGGGSFGKSMQQNLQLLARLGELQELGVPLLVGISRKSFLGELLNLPVEERLSGSLAAAAIAVKNGAKIIRAHDVKATVEAVRVAWAVMMASRLGA